MQLRRVEIVLHETALRASDRHARGGVRVHDAMRIRRVLMNRAMNGKASGIDGVWIARIELVTVHINLHQVAGSDFAVVQAEGVDEELL